MKIQAQNRELTGKKVKNLRKNDLVPASVYGPKRPSTNVQVDKKSLVKLFKDVGYSKFFDLVIEESKPVKVLIKNISRHPLKDSIIDVNFYQVDEDSKITVEVPITFTGDAPAVKQNLGFLITALENVAVYCYPKDLPSILEVNLDVLQNVGDAVTLSQLVLPEGVEFDSSVDSNAAIVSIVPPQKEIIEDVAPVAAEAVEGAEGVTAEGAAAAGTEAATAEKKE